MGYFRNNASQLAAAGALALLVVAAGYLTYRVFQNGDSATLQFITLLILFMVALAATAALFVALRLHNTGEAFGLPSGSIRTLLAVGIMMLFVVFGLPVISTKGEYVQPVRVEIPYERLTETVRVNREQGFYVQVLNPGAAGSSAVIRIIGTVPTQTAAQLDLTKQLLTAIITLLTTVIGFYFGSASSTDGMREAAGASGGPATPAPADERRPLDEGFTRLKAEIDEAAATIGRWRADPDTSNDTPRFEALGRVAPQQTELEAKRDEIAREIAAADAAVAAAAAATGEEKTRQETEARSHLRKAAETLAAARAALDSHLQAVRAIQ
jgi:hypothetical protein